MLWDYYESHPCVDCGEPDPVVHVRGQKMFNVSEAAHKGFGIERIEAEIAKCDVRCCNCHRRKTAQRGNWYRSIGVRLGAEPGF